MHVLIQNILVLCVYHTLSSVLDTGSLGAGGVNTHNIGISRTNFSIIYKYYLLQSQSKRGSSAALNPPFFLPSAPPTPSHTVMVSLRRPTGDKEEGNTIFSHLTSVWERKVLSKVNVIG